MGIIRQSNVEVGALSCSSPKELLQSRRFAEFLSLFNEHRRKSEQALIVLPEMVARDGDLAQNATDFYHENKALLSLDGNDREKLNVLVADTLVSVRTKLLGVLEEGEMRALPDWVAKYCPDPHLSIPAESARQMEEVFQQWWPYCHQHVNLADGDWSLVARMMNNFFAHFIHRNQYVAVIPGYLDQRVVCDSEKAKYGEKIRNQTWAQFYAEIDAVLGQKGLNLNEIDREDCDKANLVLLPVFLELLNRGYRVYPDLSL
jgi:hypothetical protein